MNDQKKRAIIYVFSGTGNTLIAAQKTADALFQKGILTDLYRICTHDSDLYRTAYYVMQPDGRLLASSAEQLPLPTNISEIDVDALLNQKHVASGAMVSDEFGIIPDPNSYDLAGFAYPIHAFNAPKFFLRFVKKLPSLNPVKNGMTAFLFKTSGEPFKPNSSSSHTLVRLLKKKGFIPAADMHMLMPYNIMFRYPEELAKQMYLHMESMCETLADVAVSDNIKPLHFNPFITLFSLILRIQWFGAWINGPLHKVKKADCIGCGYCERNCPTANIQMVEGNSDSRRYPKMGWKCTMCMNCTMGCPKAAIAPGFLTPWKVNPKWNFEQILADDAIADNYTDSPNAGYFKLFRKYFKKTSDDLYSELLPENRLASDEHSIPDFYIASDVGYDPRNDISDETHDSSCETDPYPDCRS